MNDSGALLSLGLALGLMLTCFAGAWVCHVAEDFLRRWRQTRANRHRWMRLLK